MPRLENWAIITHGTPYTAPEAMTAQLAGYIYDDKRFTDGTLVSTSRLEGLTLDDETKQAKSATTLNTTYTLGAMNPDFARFMAQNNVTIEDYAKNLA